MAGAYQAGFGDVNAIIQNAAPSPGKAPVMVYMIYNRAPFALIVKADSPIKTLEGPGRQEARHAAGGAASRMFPVLAEQERRSIASKVEVDQHGAQPAGADDAQGPRRRLGACSPSPAT